MSLRGDDEIDSLLAMMGGTGGAAASASADGSKKEEGKNRKKKKSKKVNRSKPVRTSYSFIESRLDRDCFRWPQSKTDKRRLILRSGLAHDCMRYTTPNGIAYGSVNCSSCGNSAATHELCISFNDQQCEDKRQILYSILTSIFLAVRNIRCILGEYYMRVAKKSTSKVASLLPPINSVQSPTSMICARLDLFQGRVLSELRKFETNYRSFCVPNINDLILLKEKAQSIIKAVASYKNTIVAIGSDTDIIDCRLEAMSSCDILYYRCYYTCITAICNSDADDPVDLLPLIPHPPTYFSCPGLAWDVLESGSEATNMFFGNSNTSSARKYAAPADDFTKSILMGSWGLKSRLDTLTENTVNNPLLALWQSRFMETIRHVWSTGYSSEVTRRALALNTDQKSSHDADVTELPQNQTIAVSDSVSVWRDSIRDYPANFYSYACPTKSSLDAIVVQAKAHSKDKTCVEAGAGTGYWSALVNAKESLIIPFDIAPPSQVTPNSYHGEIPSFTEVMNANSFDLSKMKAFHESASVLLLCYPPPASDMAVSSLSTHMQYGGSTVVHIGEWQGLTGNAAFENLLIKNFACIHSELLPFWGTDATYLTIWNQNGKQESDKSELLSPAFGYCSAQPCRNAAKRRCRFARCLQYCSEACFKMHLSSRRSYLALHMVHLSPDMDLGFNNDNHFVQLQSESTQERPRKKRKKNKR